ESMAGDIFLLGNTSWRIRRVEAGRVRVENAHGQPPTIPFWLGEAPARTAELSTAVSDLRRRLHDGLSDPEGTIAWLTAHCGASRAGAEQMTAYVRETAAVLGCVPTQDQIVAERFFDESGGMQLVLHTPFGGRINRAWGLAMRKRFCVNFDFELQAAATDDGIVLSLGEQHSFPLEAAWSFVRPHTAGPDLIQALLASPMFTNRWRWNANRSLAILRFSGGRRVPMPIQRMRAEDLLGAVFPEQVQCQDNRSGPVTPPDHPLVSETINNCLYEAMDLPGLTEIVGRIERGELRTVAVETPVPSAMSHEILNANPYAFLDDAPLEERRARAVALRRTNPDLARGVGALDASAIDEVRAQAWPDVRDADELHDALLTVGIMPTSDVPDAWQPYAKELLDAGRATVATWKAEDGWDHEDYVAAERIDLVRTVLPDVRFAPELIVPLVASGNTALLGQDEAIRSIVHGWIQVTGPIAVAALARRIGLRPSDVEIALAALEGTGIVLRGRFTPGEETEEWCERGLLSRIHRMTIGRLRKEIEAVTPADFMRFLLRWQHVQRGTQLHGRDGVTQIIGQLQGLELPAPAWEEHVLPSRIRLYDPADLEYLSLSGMVTWGRLTANGVDNSNEQNGKRRRRQAPGRNSPIAFVMREDLPSFLARDRTLEDAMRGLSSAAREVLQYLEQRGASFMADIVKSIRRMPSEVEDALWELVAHGLVSGDGVAGLRQLMHGSARERGRRRMRMMALRSGAGLGAARPHARSLPVGRWALWQPPAEVEGEERDAAAARQLLRRYGVVFRDILARERIAPAWRNLLEIYRRWEAQGEIRGGRFVSGFVGEQFALPEAVETLRAVRRIPEETEPVVVAAADPLNLVGIILPGMKVSPFSGMAVAYKNGVAVDVAPMGVLLSRLQRTIVNR
ncbi:MAG: DEAD/DEAH box helicase, partial [Armatimonadetes bacterium]|nr:DEAD/DEAH box helicase [Armatimonadota bacterium]